MSELISGKEALIAVANGKEVEIEMDGVWLCGGDFKATQIEFVLNDYYRFRIKPRTITLNGIEAPAPFEPRIGDWFYYVSGDHEYGYGSRILYKDTPKHLMNIGAWRTEEEIKQVVEALRSILK